MRRIVGGVFQSLDGVMQAPGGPTEDPTGGFAHGGWLTGLFDEVAGATVRKLFTPPYALLLGRRTYDIFAAYWPYVHEEAAMGQALTSADKYVLTHGNQPLEWANSHRLGDMDAVAALKETDGPDLLIQGSGTLYPALLERGLLDRLTTLTFPVVLGEGKRTFAAGVPASALKLIDHQISPNGVVIAIYEPAGEIPTGSFEVVEPNPREQERQAKMKGAAGDPALRPPLRRVRMEGADRGIRARRRDQLPDGRSRSSGEHKADRGAVADRPVSRARRRRPRSDPVQRRRRISRSPSRRRAAAGAGRPARGNRGAADGRCLRRLCQRPRAAHRRRCPA